MSAGTLGMNPALMALLAGQSPSIEERLTPQNLDKLLSDPGQYRLRAFDQKIPVYGNKDVAPAPTAGGLPMAATQLPSPAPAPPPPAPGKNPLATPYDGGKSSPTEKAQRMEAVPPDQAAAPAAPAAPPGPQVPLHQMLVQNGPYSMTATYQMPDSGVQPLTSIQGAGWTATPTPGMPGPGGGMTQAGVNDFTRTLMGGGLGGGPGGAGAGGMNFDRLLDMVSPARNYGMSPDSAARQIALDAWQRQQALGVQQQAENRQGALGAGHLGLEQSKQSYEQGGAGLIDKLLQFYAAGGMPPTELGQMGQSLEDLIKSRRGLVGTQTPGGSGVTPGMPQQPLPGAPTGGEAPEARFKKLLQDLTQPVLDKSPFGARQPKIRLGPDGKPVQTSLVDMLQALESGLPPEYLNQNFKSTVMPELNKLYTQQDIDNYLNPPGILGSGVTLGLYSPLGGPDRAREVRDRAVGRLGQQRREVFTPSWVPSWLPQVQAEVPAGKLPDWLQGLNRPQ